MGWRSWCNEVCEVVWSDSEQGLEELIVCYRNSSLMGDSIPDECKPAIFVNGVRAPFPLPTHQLVDDDDPQITVVPIRARVRSDEVGDGSPTASLPEAALPDEVGDGSLAQSAHVAGLPELHTTLILQNVPTNYTREMMVGLFDNNGFAGQYDFVFLPIDFRTKTNQGHAFVNLVNPLVAAQFWDAFNGFSRWWRSWMQEVCEVSWSRYEQGLEANVKRYQNSPLMHEMVPDACKPAIYANGVRQPFPPPTKKVRMPRMRNRHAINSGSCLAIIQK